VRLITATNRDLPAAVTAGRFRQDLFFRLRGVLLRVPSLRERLADLPVLAESFLAEAARKYGRPMRRISEEAMVLLRGYPWPGNVRELKMVIQTAVLAPTGETLEPHPSWTSLLDGVGAAAVAPGAAITPPPAVSPTEGVLTLREMERRHIEAVLKATGGNKAQASRLLDISRPTLDRKIAEYEIPLQPRKRKDEDGNGA
jgi:DNA-binding NtrC family response regulator